MSNVAARIVKLVFTDPELRRQAAALLAALIVKAVDDTQVIDAVLSLAAEAEAQRGA